MRAALRSGFYVSLLLVFCVSLAACDGLGTDDSEPAWVGDWRMTEVEGEPLPTVLYYSYTQDRWEVIIEGEEGCRIFRYDIVDIKDDTITASLNGELRSYALSASRDSILVTITRSNNTLSEGTRFGGESVEADPRELAGC